MEAFKRCIYVHPFHEEDPIGLVKLIGADNVLFGSDFPHPEGMGDPLQYSEVVEGMTQEAQELIMGGTIARAMKVGKYATA
jgi:predicted TIM-barrel fold metal-dependent hydrolase